MRKRKTKIRPPRTRTRTVTFPYIVCRNGQETRHRARLTVTYDATADAYFPIPTQLAAVIHRHIPGGAVHRRVEFDDVDSCGDMFVSHSRQRGVVDVVGGARIYVRQPGDTSVVFAERVVNEAPWSYAPFDSFFATARKKGGSARAR